MTDSIITPEPIYEVVITHPKGKTVTARALPVVGEDDYRGALPNGTTFTATLTERDNGEVWAGIVNCEDVPLTEGYHAALRYPNAQGRMVTFATWKKVGDPTEPEPVPILPRYYVKPDHENRYKWNYTLRETANPGTAAILPVSSTESNYPQTDYAKLDQKWLNFWKDLLAMQLYGRVMAKLTKTEANKINSAFKDLTSSIKAYTNGHGTEGPKPAMESLITMDNYVYEVARAKSTGRKTRNAIMIALYSFDASETPPVVTKETLKDPRVQYAKIINKPRVEGQLPYFTNFTHLGKDTQGNVIPVPVPFITTGRKWVPEEDLRKV